MLQAACAILVSMLWFPAQLAAQQPSAPAEDFNQGITDDDVPF